MKDISSIGAFSSLDPKAMEPSMQFCHLKKFLKLVEPQPPSAHERQKARSLRPRARLPGTTI